MRRARCHRLAWFVPATVLAPLLVAQGSPANGPSSHSLCRVHTQSARVHGLTLHPQGALDFTLDLEGASATATLPPDAAQETSIVVDGPLVFEGTTANAIYRLTRPLDTRRGMVHLGLRAALEGVHMRGKQVVGAARLGAESHSVLVSEVEAECTALTLDDDPTATGHWGGLPVGTSTWVSKAATLDMFERPSEGGASLLHLSLDQPADVVFQELAQQDDWVRLVLDVDDGSKVRGWVPRSVVDPVDGTTGHGSGVGRGCGTSCDAGDYVDYRGPATIAAGATVFAGEGIGPWARISARTPFLTQVIHFRGSAWAGIERVPGVRLPASRGGQCGCGVPLGYVARGDASWAP